MLPTAVFITTDIISELGYFCPPGLLHMYLDNSWKAWGEGAGCLRYREDVVIEHLHPDVGKAQSDSSYSESSSLMEPDRQAYAAYEQSGALAADIGKIRSLV